LYPHFLHHHPLTAHEHSDWISRARSSRFSGINFRPSAQLNLRTHPTNAFGASFARVPLGLQRIVSWPTPLQPSLAGRVVLLDVFTAHANKVYPNIS